LIVDISARPRLVSVLEEPVLEEDEPVLEEPVRISHR
jgi:hypothetical protein